MTSELLLHDVRTYGGGRRHDILLRNGRIAAIAPRGVLAGAERVDLDGRFVGPGLWDEHVHFTQWVIRRSRVDLSAATSAAQTLDIVRAALAAAPPPPDTVLTGFGFRDALWPDAPTLRAIDALAPNVPVVLVSADLHCGWVNSRAAARLGVTADASGLVREDDWISSPALDEDGTLTVEHFGEAADAAARRGVVGIVDFEHADNVREWPHRVAAGVSALRVEASIWPDRLDEAVARDLRTGTPLDPDGLVTVGRLKIVADGSLNTRTALCWDPYPGHGHGIANFTPAQVRELVDRAHRNGITAAVHAIGDRANAEVIDVFEQLGVPGTIEHAQLVRPADVTRFAEHGLVASVQPEHAMDDRDIAEHHWAGRTNQAFAYGSLHAAGVPLRLGSDAPVAPLDPWLAIASATSRSRDDRTAWHPEQCLPVDVALAASARGRTSIAEGDPADLVIMDRDPTTASRDELRAMPIAGTLVGGRWTWRAT